MLRVSAHVYGCAVVKVLVLKAYSTRSTYTNILGVFGSGRVMCELGNVSSLKSLDHHCGFTDITVGGKFNSYLFYTVH